MNHDQPFYDVLPDEHDCTRLFHGVRSSKYVAQVILPLSPSPPPPSLVHPPQMEFSLAGESALVSAQHDTIAVHLTLKDAGKSVLAASVGCTEKR